MLEVIIVVLAVFSILCAVGGTVGLVSLVKALRGGYIQEIEENGVRAATMISYAAIVVIWLFVGNTVLGLM